MDGLHGAYDPANEETESPSYKVVLTRKYLEKHCAENIRLNTLADLTGLSPCRLNRIFATQVGMPPHKYQNMLRIREVKRLVVQGSDLANAAAEAGFSDQSHMTRCFKKVMGMTPGTYVKGICHQAGNSPKIK
ncbi:MAG: helix-turn-helix transcriptional regulator [Pseudodesulfovibrio sp.]|nr:helix-turn-helix transcriptional regulator [Pseudodesulfovibrio sp.]